MQIPHAKFFEILILLKWFHSLSFEHFTFMMLILYWLTWLYVCVISLGMILFTNMLFVYDNGCIFREPCLGMKSRERINSWNCRQVVIYNNYYFLFYFFFTVADDNNNNNNNNIIIIIIIIIKVSFSIVWSVILYLRGSRSRRRQLDFVDSDLQIENIRACLNWFFF